MSNFSSRCALAALVAAPAATQTFVVDANGGPGANFTSIAAAVAAVPDGAVLLVRPGSYAPFTITAKGLTVLGDAGALVTGAFQVVGTSPTQSVVVRQLQVHAGGPALTVQQCQGPVFLQRLAPPLSLSGPQLVTTGSSQVLLDACELAGSFTAPAAAITSSTVVLVDTTAIGVIGNGMNVIASDVQLAGGSVRGGIGGGPQTADGISLTNASVRILGAATVHQGLHTTFYSYAVAGTGTLRRGPQVVFSGLVGSGVASTQAREAALTVAGGALGTTVVATLLGDSGALGAVAIGEIGPPLVLSGFADALWLQPATVTPLAAAVFGPPLTATVNVPTTLALLGRSFGWQGVTFAPAAAAAMSNAAWVTVR